MLAAAVFLPLLGAFIAGFFGRFIGDRGAHIVTVLGVALAALAGRGLFRVLVEGGPGILGLLIDEDLLDELCLTIAPLLVGGAAGRIVTGSGEAHTPMRRSHLLTDDAGYLYVRYARG